MSNNTPIIPPPSLVPSRTRSGGSTGKGSKFSMTYGTRDIKAYPVSEEDLGALFWMGVSATFAFSVAAGLLGFGLDIHKDLALGVQIPKEAIAFWSVARNFSFLVSGLATSIGLFLLYQGRTKIATIKKQTTF